MRALLPCLLVLVLGAGEEPAPANVTLTCGDLPGWARSMAGTWVARVLADPAAAPERAALAGVARRLRDDTGLALPAPARLAAVRLGVGDDGHHLRSWWWLDGPTDAVLAGVPAAVARRSAEQAERARRLRAYYSALHTTGAAAPPTLIPDRIGFAVVQDGLRFGEAFWDDEPDAFIFSTWSASAANGVFALHRLAVAEVPALPARPAATPDLTLEIDAATLLRDTGVPLLCALAQATGLGSIALTIGAEGGDVRETARLAATLPLRAVDPASLGGQLPRATLALTAAGIDGPALAALLSACVPADPDTAALGTLLTTLDGTWSLAVVDGQPLPDLVLGVPASPAADHALAALVDTLARGRIDSAQVLQRARAGVATLPGIPRLCDGLALRRTPGRWLVATSARALADLGETPALAQLPPADAGTLALAWQDNAALAHLIATRAGVAWLALRLQGLAGAGQDGAVSARRAAQATLAERGSRLGTAVAALARPSSWTLRRDGAGLECSARSGLLAAATAPVGLAWWWYALPVAVPEAGLDAFVSMGRRASVWSDPRAEYAQDFWTRLGSPGYYPDAVAGLSFLGEHASGPATRTAALGELVGVLRERSAEVQPLLLRACAEPARQPRQTALLLVSAQLDRAGTGPAVVLDAIARAWMHPDRHTRLMACSVLLHRAQLLRLGPPLDGAVEAMPPALFAPLVAAYERETDVRVRGRLLTILAAYDDDGVLTRLRAALGAPDAAVRCAALAITRHPGYVGDAAAQATVAALLDDHAPGGDGNTVAELALAALLAPEVPPNDEALQRAFANLLAVERASGWFPMLAATLCRRGHPPAVQEVIRLVDQPAGAGALSGNYLPALGACPLLVAEEALVRALVRSREDPLLCRWVLGALASRPAALQPATNTAMLPLVGAGDADVRHSARTILRRQPLSPELEPALRILEQEARSRFGPDAFGEQVPDAAGQPKPTGADDF